MPNPPLAARYAKSVIGLAQEGKQLEVLFKDMELLDEACKSNRDLVNFLRSPVINAVKKEKIFRHIFGDQLSELSNKFIVLLIKKDREGHLPEIAEAVIEQYRALNHIRRVKITTASPLSKEVEKEIIEKVKQEIPDLKIELQASINKDLIGGFILESNNNVFDASIARELNDIKRQFTENKYIAEI